MAAVVSLRARTLDAEGSPRHFPESLVADEKTAYEELIAPLESKMMRTIWRVVRRPELAEDTLQDAITVIWRKQDQIRRHPNPHALILKICLNAAYDSLRKQKRLLRHESLSRAHNLPDPSDGGAIRALEGRELEHEVLRAISRLPRKQAIAVLMRIVHEEPFDVIANTLGCSEITVRIHVFKGRARLRKWLSHLSPGSLQETSDEER
jgi:RNA polymerase sigma-70 factor (ECF subfamily)